MDVNPKIDLICPFCNELGFDEIGLAFHVIGRKCEKAEKLYAEMIKFRDNSAQAAFEKFWETI